MRGLTIFVATADPARYHAALSLAAAQAAFGGRARIHLHGDAVALLAGGEHAPRGPGEPTLTELQAEAVALGAEISACQTGLAALPGASLPPGIEPGGVIALLTALGDDRLVVF